MDQCFICPCTCYCAGGEYYNYSGCGNTLNCNQPVVRQFILDCLKYWVQVGVGRCGEVYFQAVSWKLPRLRLHSPTLPTFLIRLSFSVTSLANLLY